MRLHNISIKSIRKRIVRTLFLVFGLVIAISTVVALLNITLIMNSDISSKLDEFGANILITPQSEELSLYYGGISVSGIAYDIESLNMADVAKIKEIKNRDNIKIISPKFISVGTVSNKKVLVVGVVFDQETTLKKWWSVIGEIPSSNSEALIGSDVKKKLGLGLGDTFILSEREFKVSGILNESGSQDDQLIMIELETAQLLFRKPSEISLIEVAALCNDCPIEEIVAQTSEKLGNANVVAIQQTIKAKMESVKHFENFSLGIMIVISIVASLIVFTSMTASVNEKKKEIGIFRAIGYRQSHIMEIILWEAIIVSGISGIIGYIAGQVISVYVTALFGLNSASITFISPTFIWVIMFSVSIGVLASLIPSIKAAKIDPSIALKSL